MSFPEFANKGSKYYFMLGFYLEKNALEHESNDEQSFLH